MSGPQQPRSLEDDRRQGGPVRDRIAKPPSFRVIRKRPASNFSGRVFGRGFSAQKARFELAIFTLAKLLLSFRI